MKTRTSYGTQQRAARRGSTLVEFALVLPILLMLSMLLVQYGLILNTTLTLTNIAREGARYGAVHPATDAGIRNKVQQTMQNTPLKYDDVAVDISPPEGDATRTAGQPINVNIVFDMKKKLFLPATFFGVSIFSSSYTAHAAMNIEGS